MSYLVSKIKGRENCESGLMRTWYKKRPIQTHVSDATTNQAPASKYCSIRKRSYP